jgi:hypothetical protein
MTINTKIKGMKKLRMTVLVVGLLAAPLVARLHSRRRRTVW